MMTIRRLEVLVLIAIFALLIPIFGWPVGSRTFFSPDTLECRSERLHGYFELSFPFEKNYRNELTGYLVTQGYWKPSTTDRPRWMTLSMYYPSQRDGQSVLMSSLFWKTDDWIEWTEQHPQHAAVLWPRVLKILRRDGNDGQSAVAELLHYVWRAESEAEIDAALTQTPSAD